MTTPLTAASYTKLQLDAGIFIKNFAYNTYATADALAAAIQTAISSGTGLLGATSGGGTFAVTPTYREIDLDGKRNAFVGSRILDGVEVKLTTTLAEITPDNFVVAMGLGEASTDTTGKITTVKFHNQVKDTDYIDSLCWIGDMSDGRLVLINITKALNLAGATMTFTDKGEGKIPVEFTAHQTGITTATYAPFEVVFFDKATPTPDPDDDGDGDGGGADQT